MKQLNGHEKRSIKAVLDTNVLVSAFVFRKRLGIIEQLVKRGDITPCFTERTFEELKIVFSYPKLEYAFKKINVSQEELIEVIVEKSIIISTPSYIPQIIKSDFPDNHILACALHSGASFIISGDLRILELKHFHNIPIITPRQFLGIFNQ